MNTANKLTMLRVILIPFYLIVWYLGFAYNNIVALAIFIIASVTDFIDGYVARHYNQTTDFGKFMDPLADKVLVLTAMICFCAMGRFPAWALVIVMAREFAVSGLRMVAVDNGRVIAAGWSGKVKTFSTMVALCIMMVVTEPWFPMGRTVNFVCQAVILLTTVYSGVEYFVQNKDVFKAE